MSSVVIFSAFFFLAGFACETQAAYFSMSDVQLNIPGDKTKYPLINRSVVTLYALQENGSFGTRHPAHLMRYSLANDTVAPKERLLQIYTSSGDIMFTENFFKKDVNNISLEVFVQEPSGTKNSTTLQINVLPSSFGCDKIPGEDLCFWKSASYRIYENTQPSTIGSLNSPYLSEMCGEYRVTYELLKGGEQFTLGKPFNSGDAWTLKTTGPLDRDVERSAAPPFDTKKGEDSGEYRNVYVKCSVEDSKGVKREFAKDIIVHVLDEDDNSPKMQTAKIKKDSLGVVDIELSSNVVQKGKPIGHEDLLFVDRDSPPVNTYDIRLLNDDLDILEPNCTTYEDDREGEHQTAIHCKLIFTRDTQVARSPYVVTLAINDTALRPSREAFYIGDNATINVPIRISFRKYHQVSAVSAKTRSPSKPKRASLLYPATSEIFRTASPYARVTRPQIEFPKEEESPDFWMFGDSTGGAFNVTNKEGIVYVQNTSLLRATHQAKLAISWKNHTSRQETDEITVNIIVEPKHTCTPEPENWKVCASFNNKKACNRACGISTGGSANVERRASTGEVERCVWRGEHKPGNNTTPLYATCSPDVKTCPDKRCDPLEELDPAICPQDCAPPERLMFPLVVNRLTGRGFDMGAGVCSCVEYHGCSCEYVETKKKNKKQQQPTSQNLTDNIVPASAPSEIRDTKLFSNGSISVVQANVGRHVGTEHSKCGTACILGVAGSAIVLLFIVGVIAFCWRMERVHRAFREKFSGHQSSELHVPLSDYIDRNGGTPDALRFNFEGAAALAHRLNRIEKDPKWEFPRDRLIIEQTLGEGEFGRVLRAKALNIGGQSGHTTVAVKTLKIDAGERELTDLLSEYQLLKDVSHPNVIRLLGASTVPGGPIYLIIEFAEHGSLRNYLRKCRHIQTPNSKSPRGQFTFAPSPDAYDEPKTCQITPKDILSFAWQISNGMSYLSDIKFVHRDLAARNILVATDKICKISDFGLTRDVYEDDAYFKRSKGRVPVKWMAPESLSDHLYTHKSDVWSYGVLLWELVTLGASPYPGIAVQSLFHLLKTGYRMERPENCSVPLYKVMRSCWHADPDNRPTFLSLSQKFERMLGDQVDYLDLTNNAVNNRGYFCDNLDLDDDENDDSNDVSNIMNKETSHNGAINYLNQASEYRKCGNTIKLNLTLEEQNEEDDDEKDTDEMANLAKMAPQEKRESMQGYETPVKILNKNVTSVTTPANEFPQYEYTDMTACSGK